MTRTIITRIAQAILVTWVAYTAGFFLLYALPSDPVSLMVGPDAMDVSDTERQALAAEYGLDQPLPVQYWNSFSGVLRGDLGYSYQQGVEVSTILNGALSSTLALASLGFVFAVVGGAGIALLAAYSRRPWLRQTLLSLPSLGVSIPAFWFGLLLIQIFSFRLGWFPAFSTTGLSSMILPAITLALPTGAMIAQVFTRSLTTAMLEPFATTAYGKGANRRRVLIGHAAQNALLPVLTITGLIVGQLLSGTVVTETVFSRPGLGRIIATSVANQDLPVVLGTVLFGAVLYTVTSLLVDLLYPAFDPRQRTKERTNDHSHAS